ncbi:MAG: hypothetical protein KKE30_05770 [Gammaproteobacteria bacterium]|nr:hypothetical protein [Gammaproteobacteria bacterium]MBU1557016.1 hypothetical protein [Gammaproteobacteria bacterium]MBU2069724.1 hypothetical protein [Gammaproteobacteria bacterium]MBU2184589.1 hypothetical protein [Gammaproteobacteria bacterium]MBU2205271.1 hypothetical protein [Gammaproteobacteria bacterium]
MLQARPYVSHKFALVISLLSLCCCVKYALATEAGLPVAFYSKMSADWLNSQPTPNERLSYQALRLLLQDNDNLNPHFVQVSHSRAERLTSQDPSGCLAGVLDLPQRRQQFSFSLPFTAVQGIRLYINTDNRFAAVVAQQQNAAGTVSLSSLLMQHRTLLIGVDQDRSYGQALDTILREPALQRNILFRQSGAQIGELWRMLAEGRVDVILEYPFMQPDLLPAQTVSQQLTEAPAVETAYIACNNSPHGQAILQQINREIQTKRFLPAYLDIHLAAVAVGQQQQYLQQYRQAMQSEDN